MIIAGAEPSIRRVDDLRREFPVFERKAYLNAGTNGPVPARAAEAARAAIERQAPAGDRETSSSRACSRGWTTCARARPA